MLRELGHDLLPYPEARRIMLEHVGALDAEEVGLAGAHGRVLAEDLTARETVPAFDSSAMDGYAVRAADVAAARGDAPVALPVAAKLAAGDAPALPLAPGTTWRILTGAPVPAGCDAVVPHEQTRFSDAEAVFFAPVRAGQNIRRAGCDLRPGDVPLRRGALLRGPQIGVAAVLGRARLRVARAPRVAIVSPGNELVEPWTAPGPGQVRNSNAYSLAALVAESGGIPSLEGIVPDSPEALRRAFAAAVAAGADLILTTGGVSAGDHDYVQEVVRRDGRPGHVFKVAMRPGKPQVFGRIGGVPLFGLPGNPAAAIVSFTVFVQPALRKLLGETPWVPDAFLARFPSEFRYRSGRVFLLRARVEADLERGGFRVAKVGEQDSSVLSSLAEANALVELPADRELIRAGDVCPARWIHCR